MIIEKQVRKWLVILAFSLVFSPPILIAQTPGISEEDKKKIFEEEFKKITQKKKRLTGPLVQMTPLA